MKLPTLKEWLFGPKDVKLKTGTLPISPVGVPAISKVAKYIPKLLKPVAKVAKFVVTKPKTALGLAVGVPTAVGVLKVSPKARSLISPFKAEKRGEELGKIIEDPSKLFPKEKEKPIEKIKEIAKTAGIVAVPAAAAAAGVAVAAKKIKEAKEKVISSPEQIATLPSETLPATEEPLGAMQPEPQKVPIEAAPVSMPSIKNVFKPSIDIRVSQRKTRKFINQQVVIR